MSRATATVTRFVFLTDTHYHPQAPQDFGAPKMLTRASEVLAATAPAINAVAPDFIVHGGDLLCGGGSFELSPKHYEQSLRDVSQAFSRFSAPTYYVPGNHDCDAVEYSFIAFAETFRTPEILDVVEVAPRLRLALANLFHGDYHGSGEWTEELDAALRAADVSARDTGAGLLLVMHSWVMPNFVADGESPDAGCVRGAERLRATLEECRAVVAVFTGHRHANRIRLLGDLIVVDTACLIGYPFGFRELTIDVKGWMDCHFHQLELPDLMQASYQRSDELWNDRWRGEEGDRNSRVLLPRLHRLWR
ncbi:MAG: metallophosphoesterase [Candidatus Latescibacterota bacterium]|nr:metallophosphoesterase [Candidatus Latescibacterota bacterium]